MSHQLRRRSTLAWTALVAIAAACSSPMGTTNDNPPSVKLLVVNGTCSVSGCGEVHVLGFPTADQPLTPGGLWSIDLGATTAPQVCLTIPATATFRIIGQTSATTADTITKVWTTMRPLALGTLSPDVTRFQATPSTDAFEPGMRPGWRVTLPGDGAPIPSDACGG
jgi:hypothetical protein